MPEDANTNQVKEELAVEEKENEPIEYVYGYIKDVVDSFYEYVFLYNSAVDAFKNVACKFVYFVRIEKRYTRNGNFGSIWVNREFFGKMEKLKKISLLECPEEDIRNMLQHRHNAIKIYKLLKEFDYNFPDDLQEDNIVLFNADFIEIFPNVTKETQKGIIEQVKCGLYDSRNEHTSFSYFCYNIQNPTDEFIDFCCDKGFDYIFSFKRFTQKAVKYLLFTQKDAIDILKGKEIPQNMDLDMCYIVSVCHFPEAIQYIDNASMELIQLSLLKDDVERGKFAIKLLDSKNTKRG